MNICIYGASSPDIDNSYFAPVEALGRAMAKRGFGLVFGGGAQGVDGVKYLAACGGAVVLIVFILQVAAAIKVFFLDPETKKDIVDSVDQIEQ